MIPKEHKIEVGMMFYPEVQPSRVHRVVRFVNNYVVEVELAEAPRKRIEVAVDFLHRLCCLAGDLTPTQWRRAAKFCGFKDVPEYKRWLLKRKLGE